MEVKTKLFSTVDDNDLMSVMGMFSESTGRWAIKSDVSVPPSFEVFDQNSFADSFRVQLKVSND